MKQPLDPRPLTYDEFVAYAEAHEGRFEYVDGQVVAMGSPSLTHQRIVRILTTLFQEQLAAAGNGCEALPTPMVWTVARVRQRSPDVVVYCDGEPARLVCEVLSPNRGDDLEQKLTEYQAMPQFEEYLIVDSTKRWVRLYRRGASGLFEYDVDHVGGSVRLASIGYTLDVDALYEAAPPVA